MGKRKKESRDSSQSLKCYALCELGNGKAYFNAVLLPRLTHFFLIIFYAAPLAHLLQNSSMLHVQI